MKGLANGMKAQVLGAEDDRRMGIERKVEVGAFDAAMKDCNSRFQPS